MKNDYKMIHCAECGSEHQHYKCWTCGKYAICLSCSNAGRYKLCPNCVTGPEPKEEASVKTALFTTSMLIEEGYRYEIKVKNIDSNQKLVWRLHIVPEKRAWKLANQVVSVGQNLNCYEILSIATIGE